MRTHRNPATSEWRKLCQRPTLDRAAAETTVASIFQRVKLKGDEALLAYAQQFDEVKLSRLDVPIGQLQSLADRVPKELRTAIDTATANIEKFHRSQMAATRKSAVQTMPGVLCWRESRPVERVGLYVPGGSAPLFSTALMLGVPAQLAGCKEIVLCSPPNRQGELEPALAYAALKCGITNAFVVGGAQAIAAMTFGTESIPAVDKIFGPGNQYVTNAKMYAQNFGVAIDMPAGPSEVMVVADSSARPAFVAADLLSQAEHGPDSQVVLVTSEPRLAEGVSSELKRQIQTLPRKTITERALDNSFCVVFDDAALLLEFANAYAPEHLILCVKKSGAATKEVINAGSVFLGNFSPESAGDYASGTNHTLPTNGWARSYSGLSVESFCKYISFQKITQSGMQALAPTITVMASAEGLAAHAQAASIRINSKQSKYER